MKMFRRVFDYIKGCVSCDECECKADDIIELRKQLKKLQTKKRRKEYVKENKEVVFKK